MDQTGVAYPDRDSYFLRSQSRDPSTGSGEALGHPHQANGSCRYRHPGDVAHPGMATIMRWLGSNWVRVKWELRATLPAQSRLSQRNGPRLTCLGRKPRNRPSLTGSPATGYTYDGAVNFRRPDGWSP